MGRQIETLISGNIVINIKKNNSTILEWKDDWQKQIRILYSASITFFPVYCGCRVHKFCLESIIFNTIGLISSISATQNKIKRFLKIIYQSARSLQQIFWSQIKYASVSATRFYFYFSSDLVFIYNNINYKTAYDDYHIANNFFKLDLYKD